jgi:hypothetical protein
MRDRILLRVAWDARTHRDCVRKTVRSFDDCVRRIAELSGRVKPSR